MQMVSLGIILLGEHTMIMPPCRVFMGSQANEFNGSKSDAALKDLKQNLAKWPIGGSIHL